MKTHAVISLLIPSWTETEHRIYLHYQPDRATPNLVTQVFIIYSLISLYIRYVKPGNTLNSCLNNVPSLISSLYKYTPLDSDNWIKEIGFKHHSVHEILWLSYCWTFHIASCRILETNISVFFEVKNIAFSMYSFYCILFNCSRSRCSDPGFSIWMHKVLKFYWCYRFYCSYF